MVAPDRPANSRPSRGRRARRGRRLSESSVTRGDIGTRRLRCGRGEPSWSTIDLVVGLVLGPSSCLPWSSHTLWSSSFSTSVVDVVAGAVVEVVSSAIVVDVVSSKVVDVVSSSATVVDVVSSATVVEVDRLLLTDTERPAPRVLTAAIHHRGQGRARALGGAVDRRVASRRGGDAANSQNDDKACRRRHDRSPCPSHHATPLRQLRPSSRS